MKRRSETMPVVLDVSLHNAAGETKLKSIEISEARNVQILKQAIEDKFSIPVCSQRLFFESNQFRENENLSSYRFRDGDTIHVYYGETADMEAVQGLIAAVKCILVFVEHLQPELSSKHREVKTDCISADRPDIVKDIVLIQQKAGLFKKLTNCANSLLFITSGGLDLVFSLYSLVLEIPWKDTLFQLQRLELNITSLLQRLIPTETMSPAHQAHLLRRTLNQVTRSLLRVSVHKREPVGASKGFHTMHYEQDAVNAHAIGLIGTSVALLTK